MTFYWNWYRNYYQSDQSAEFIETAIDISNALNGRPTHPPLDDLLASISTDFGVHIRSGDDHDNCILVSRNALTFTFAEGGDDHVWGRAGTDVIFGGTGNDKLLGWGGDDALFGQDGDDRLYGMWGDDYIDGGDGNDIISGGSGNDIIEGGFGDDHIYGGSGDDMISAGPGADVIYAGRGNDTVEGNSTADTIYGGKGDDNIDGGGGADMIDGGKGDDFIDGGIGDDFLVGGSGADSFFFDPSARNEGVDVIDDFHVGEDVLILSTHGLLRLGAENADGDPELSGNDLDVLDTFILQASADGDLEIVHPNGSIELNGIAYDAHLTFAQLVEDGVVDFG